ncbi:hypothetical protein [Aliirhizobium smilacinae]|uniref:Transmembrane anchored protein n=1 Tax=Aliirhizobium smilacinae TaxID=1395944 RepID=A0A5C4XFQ1_9HYPH|nr:hypothetical protein [Rhizobium smilacinae]TNM62109.1 hypothetical protein FHP24_18605 [Rhizobium smilacinae]
MTRRATAPPQEDLPLISDRFLLCLTLAAILLILVTLAISIGGRWLGQRMALGGHSESGAALAITIGEDTLHIPENTIRFAEQRRSGPAERIDLYLTWPGLMGYSQEYRDSFDNAGRPDLLLFLQISQSTMSKDMSGRLEPIYSQLFDGPAESFGDGLTLHHLKNTSGYGSEVLLTADRPGQPPFAVRCLLPAAEERATSGDCQRDIHVGRDLSVLYRFSSSLLKDWDHIDAAVASFVGARIDATGSNPAPKGN